MSRHPIEFQFKGSRTYVHGTDIYNQASAFAVEKLGSTTVKDVSMTIHKIMKSQLTAEEVDIGAIKREDTSVAFTFFDGKEKRKLFLAESGEEITGRYEYPEDSIVEPCDFDSEAKTLTLTTPTPYTDIEVFVAMNKGLMQKLFPDAPGKWYFTRFELDEYAERSNYKNITLTLIKNVKFKLTKTSIVVDGQDKGFIYFSLV